MTLPTSKALSRGHSELGPIHMYSSDGSNVKKKKKEKLNVNPSLKSASTRGSMDRKTLSCFRCSGDWLEFMIISIFCFPFFPQNCRFSLGSQLAKLIIKMFSCYWDKLWEICICIAKSKNSMLKRKTRVTFSFIIILRTFAIMVMVWSTAT